MQTTQSRLNDIIVLNVSLIVLYAFHIFVFQITKGPFMSPYGLASVVYVFFDIFVCLGIITGKVDISAYTKVIRRAFDRLK